MISRETIEVLAPAGSFESMKAAVCAGADAVYMGGSRFGARAYADSVGEDMVLQAIEYCHAHGRKLYMTVNTLLKERELEQELYEYLLPYYEAGLDAVIVQDLGVFSYIRRQFPDLPVHASTQMTITGPGGAKFVGDMGAARLVTARELSLQELKEIRQSTDLEIEAFVHGAICYCYSGQCLYSSIIGGRSGNRGRCAQPCRLPYRVRCGKDALNRKSDSYVLNLKDMRTLEDLPELLEAGVNSLKIEGRMKSPLYTAGVVSIYRKYVDLYLEKGKAGYCVDSKDIDMLSQLFDRGGYTDTYLKKHNGADMLALKEKPAFRKIDPAIVSYLENTYVNAELKEKIQGDVRISEGFSATMSITWQDISVTVEGAVVDKARSKPLSYESVEKQMKKLGNTPYIWENLAITLEGDGFLPVQAVNELRRNALEALEEAIRVKYRRGAAARIASVREETKKTASWQPKLHVSLEQLEFLDIVLEAADVETVYLDSTELDFARLSEYVKACHHAGKGCYVVLPYIFRGPAKKRVLKALPQIKTSGLDGIIVRNLEEITFVREELPNLSFITDAGVYSWNQEAKAVLKELGAKYTTAPYELNEKELEARGMTDSELVVYGRLPMMITANCVKNTLTACNHKVECLQMEDRKQVDFPVKTCCNDCYNIIYNSRPMSLCDQRAAVEKLAPDSVRISFTLESAAQMRAVLSQFRGSWQKESFDADVFTRGHFKRGVE